MEAWADGAYTEMMRDGTLQANAKAIGMCEMAKIVQDVDLETLLGVYDGK
jgi:hypothetical protein